MRNRKAACIVGAAVLCVAVLTLSWIFGWRKGELNALDFGADEVESITFYCDSAQISPTTITDPEDVQALIDEINGFPRSGNMLKKLFTHGPFSLSLGDGGHICYEFQMVLKSGEMLKIALTTQEDGYFSQEEERDMSFYRSDKKVTPLPLCRGSVDLFFTLYHKYNPA